MRFASGESDRFEQLLIVRIEHLARTLPQSWPHAEVDGLAGRIDAHRPVSDRLRLVLEGHRIVQRAAAGDRLDALRKEVAALDVRFLAASCDPA